MLPGRGPAQIRRAAARRPLERAGARGRGALYPPTDRFPKLPEAEFAGMQPARSIGAATADCRLLSTDKRAVAKDHPSQHALGPMTREAELPRKGRSGSFRARAMQPGPPTA